METIQGTLPMGKVDLWDAFDDTDGPHFNLSVDLNSCTVVELVSLLVKQKTTFL
jgi:hypothetical protein